MESIMNTIDNLMIKGNPHCSMLETVADGFLEVPRRTWYSREVVLLTDDKGCLSSTEKKVNGFANLFSNYDKSSKGDFLSLVGFVGMLVGSVIAVPCFIIGLGLKTIVLKKDSSAIEYNKLFALLNEKSKLEKNLKLSENQIKYINLKFNADIKKYSSPHFEVNASVEGMERLENNRKIELKRETDCSNELKMQIKRIGDEIQIFKTQFSL